MGIFHNLMQGFSAVLTPYNLWMATIGCFFGTIVGILPGLGPSATIAMLLPFTFGMNATPAMIMMTSIYYGAKYGGSTTSILINVPGEGASVVTALDGYQMARKGRAGPALGIAAIGSFFAGIVGTFGLIFIAVPLAEFSLRFGPAEYFSLIIMGMLTIVFVGGKSITKSLMSGVIGLALGVVGSDVVQGAPRFVYGVPELMDGISFVVVVMGIFGIGEVLVSAEERMKLKPVKVKLSGLFPTLADLVQSKWAIARGTIVGFFVGALPGAGSTIASFISYGIEKGASKHPERFGKGAIEGVAAPESANNSATSGAMVPLLALGIPGSGATAVMLGALMLYGLKPGPMLFHTSPDFVWALIASMFIGNVILLIMNLPMIPLFASTLRIPYGLLYPAIILICIIGSYSLNNNVFDVWVMLIFGVFGYFMKKYDIPGAPMVIALVLGPLLEYSLYQALALSHGDITVFVTRPISATLLGMAAAMTVAVTLKTLRMIRKQISEEED
ncbi:MAG: tripartite tricarboxylate transporter permease [Deltaproteobacteria bacterium]|nr:tripartite tricarboxylate transporter permease [Deltaproteobacteria bacterium]MBW2306492.1 tripartite tricarboxylate transporter permease [Deltaproteobacteria bacterium]